MTAQEVYNQLPNDIVELSIIGGDFAKKNKENKYSILFNEQMNSKTVDLIEIKKTVARLVSSVNK